MHLLYADESGLVEDMSQRHFVLAGVCVFESATQNIASNLDAIITCFAPHMPELELHGSPIRSGKGFFRKIALADREQDSRASRLVQLADLVAYSLFRHFEHSDSQYFDLLKHRFDQDAETQHGFVLVRTP
jgi:hypothetical protein